MKINLISNIGEGSTLEDVGNFNRTIAWFIHEALEKQGVDARLVRDRDLLTNPPPEADHAIVISNIAMNFVAGTHKAVRGRVPSILSQLRKATKGKISIYLDADYPQWFKYFDHVFTVVKPQSKDPKCVYAGWGADPEYCYPDQDEKALFLDSLMYEFYKGRFNPIYDIYKKVLPSLDIKVYDPWPTYHNSVRLLWTQVQDILRKTHFHCCTQLGESGLTRIEAATSGALLVVPRALYKPRTMASLEHKIWSTEEELIKILTTETDPTNIRKKALAHSWDKVASRILETLA